MYGFQHSEYHDYYLQFDTLQFDTTARGWTWVSRDDATQFSTVADALYALQKLVKGKDCVIFPLLRIVKLTAKTEYTEEVLA